MRQEPSGADLGRESLRDLEVEDDVARGIRGGSACAFGESQMADMMTIIVTSTRIDAPGIYAGVTTTTTEFEVTDKNEFILLRVEHVYDTPRSLDGS